MNKVRIKANKFYQRKTDGIFDLSKEPLVFLEEARTLVAQDSGSTFVFNAAAGFTVTLPAATGSGVKYKFIVGTTVTSVADKVICSAATEYFAGMILGAADAGDTVAAFEATSTADYVSMDGSTTGGIIGDQFTVTDIATGVWAIEGTMSQTGTEATPFGST